MSVTNRIERAIKALEAGRLKEALYLTDKTGLERHNAWVREAARKALEDKENTKKYLREARDRLTETITAPLDDTSLEGVEEMLDERAPEPKSEMTDEELYENCEECHIANAVVATTEICEKHPQTACTLITSRLDKEDVQPGEWLKLLFEARDKSEGKARQEFDMVLSDLIKYLERRNSPFLKNLE